MKRVIGYVVALAGLFILTFGAGIINLPLFAGLDSSYINIVGIGLVIIGVYMVVAFSKSSSNKKLVDLPVYEGENVVAYRRNVRK